jgi:crotonobetainyl-CoA:carnitine CoA-transferase CaiB-like acyl-CoA transferase
VKFRVQSLSELLNSARPAPWIGDHNSYVFGKILGMSEAEIKELKEAGAIR